MPKHVPETLSPEKSLVSSPAQAPWSLMGLQSEIDRLFDNFTRGFGWPSLQRSDLFGNGLFRRLESTVPTMSPQVNITETDAAYEIEAELPGLDGKDVEVKVADGILTISGERKEEKEEKKKDYHLMERRYGSFQRSFELPDNVVEDKIDAKFAKGVLTVTMPKSERGKLKENEKKIEIKTS